MNKLEEKQSYFVTGTDTDCGKTLVSAALLHKASTLGLSTAAVKPVAAGAAWSDGRYRNEDGLILQSQCNPLLEYQQVNPVCLQAAIAPHIAARYENVSLTVGQLHAACKSVMDQDTQFTIIEGAGGWLVPLNDTETLADLACALAGSHQTTVVLVVRIQLGCINHALLSVQSIVSRGLTLSGWIANCATPYEEQENNIDALLARIAAPCLGTLPYIPSADASIAATHIQLP